MIAFWLLPAEPSRQFFQSLIGELAARVDAPVFEPHMTLLGGIADHDRAVPMFRRVSAGARCELEIEGIHFSERYTQTLFVRFRLSDELRELRRVLADALDSEIANEFDPHLSLLYKAMPLPELEELAKSIQLPFQRVTFERLKLITHPPEVAQREDVEAFREIDWRG